MTTSSIPESFLSMADAFEYGSGDYFFQNKKTRRFVCVSENNPVFIELSNSEDWEFYPKSAK